MILYAKKGEGVWIYLHHSLFIQLCMDGCMDSGKVSTAVEPMRGLSLTRKLYGSLSTLSVRNIELFQHYSLDYDSSSVISPLLCKLYSWK